MNKETSPQQEGGESMERNELLERALAIIQSSGARFHSDQERELHASVSLKIQDRLLPKSASKDAPLDFTANERQYIMQERDDLKDTAHQCMADAQILDSLLD